MVSRGLFIMRVGLALYLMLVILAGPWICCCTAHQLLPAHGLAAPSAHPKLSCCSQPEDKPAQETPTDPPLNSNRSCSCQDEQPSALLSNPDASSTATDFTLASLFVLAGQAEFAADHTIELQGIHSQSPGRSSAFPFLDSQDILCILQILRC